MQSISKFDSTVYSEELFDVSESDYDEVMAASAVEDEKWEGYSEWSADLEQAQFEASLEARATIQTANGAMLIKRECAHSECPADRCKQSVRLGGIEI